MPTIFCVVDRVYHSRDRDDENQEDRIELQSRSATPRSRWHSALDGVRSREREEDDISPDYSDTDDENTYGERREVRYGYPDGPSSSRPRTERGRDSDPEFDWNEADALKERSIIEALRKFQGHQALQNLMYKSMHVARRQGRQHIPVYEEETGNREFVSPVDQHDYAEDDPDQMRANVVELPLKETVAEFVEAVDKQSDVVPLNAQQFRELIQPLSEKKKEFRRLNNQVDANVSPTVRRTVSRFRQNFSRFLENALDTLKPFSGLLKWVDSSYGSDVHSYFVFVLWIIGVNLVTFVALFVFAVTPSVFWHDRNNGSVLLVNTDATHAFHGVDILTGKGGLEDSFFHYKFYLSDFATIFGNWYYDRTMGYLVALGFFYLFQFLVLTYALTQSYGKLVSSSTMGGKTHYCDTVFFMWEFSTSDREAIGLARTHLQTTLREKLTATRRQAETGRNSVYFSRIVLNALILLGIAGVSVGLWFFLDHFETEKRSVERESSGHYGMELAAAIFITFINIVLPFIFSLLTKFEVYTTYEGELLSSLAKGVTLTFGSLGVVYYYFLINKSGQDMGSLVNNRKDCLSIKMYGSKPHIFCGIIFIRASAPSVLRPAPSDVNQPAVDVAFFVWITLSQTVPCWENGISHKFHQLQVMNIIFEWGFSLIGLAAALIVIKSRSKDARPLQVMFRADLLTQRVIYLQTLAYLSTYYSPVICGFTTLTIFLMFIRDGLIVRLTKLYKSAPLGSGNEGAQAVYCGALLVSFLLATASVAFSITVLLPSTDCGPFRSLCPDPDIIVAVVNRLQHSVPWLYTILDIIVTPAVLGMIMLFLVVLVYYYHVKANALRELAPVLQNHLTLEEKDVIALYLPMVAETQAPANPGYKRKGPRAKHSQAEKRDARRKQLLKPREQVREKPVVQVTRSRV